MSRTGNLLINTALFFVASFASKFLSIILVPIYVSYISTDDFGGTSLMILFSGLVGIVSSLDIIDAAYRFLLDDGTDKSKVISNSIFTFLIGLLLFTILYVSICYNNIDLIHVWLLLNIIICNFNLLVQQIVRGLKLNKIFAISGVLMSLVQGLLNIILIVFFKIGSISIIIAPVLASLFSLIYIFISSKMYQYIALKDISLSLIKKLMSYGWPLCVGIILNWMILNSGTYILTWFTGSTSQSGVYALSVKISSILYMGMSVFNMAWQETSVEEFGTPKFIDYFNKVFSKYIIYVIYTICLLLIAISCYFNLGKTGDYEMAKYFVPILLLGNSFYSMQGYLQTGFYVIKKTKHVSHISIICGLSSIFVGIFSIHFFGIWGLIFTVCGGQLLLLLLTYRKVKQYINYNIRLDSDLIKSIGLLLLNIFTYYVGNTMMMVIVFVFTFMTIGFIEKSNLFKVVNYLIRRFNRNE